MATTKTQEGKLPSYVSLLSPGLEAFPFIQAWQFGKAKLKVPFLTLPWSGWSWRSCPRAGQAPCLLATAPSHLAGKAGRGITAFSPGGKGPGRLPTTLHRRASPGSLILEHAVVCQGWPCTAAKPSQGQGKGSAGPVAPSGPGHLPAVYPDVLSLYLWTYHSTIKYIPLRFYYLISILCFLYCS